jgi:peptidoglycan/xylan/chitin deacetylase (PgdA/CDA1 family)
MLEALSMDGRTPTVVVYHAIAHDPAASAGDRLCVSAAAFERQMEYLSRRRTVVSLDGALDGGASAARSAVAITFDDGFRSVLTVALPILRRLGFPATVFVPTRWLEEPAAAGGGEDPAPFDLLTTDDVGELRQQGFEVGSHGHTHTDLGRLGRAAIEAELRASVERLTEITGVPPRHLAWPYGHVSAEAVAAAEATGFEAGFTTDLVTRGRFAVSRVPIDAADGSVAYALKTSGRVALWRHAGAVLSLRSRVRPARATVHTPAGLHDRPGE